MTLLETLPYLSAGCALTSTLVAVLVARRSQRWRDTDDGQALVARVDATESRLDKLETRTADLPTKADLAEVRGEIHAVDSTINRIVVPGLNRLESCFIELGVKAK